MITYVILPVKFVSLIIVIRILVILAFMTVISAKMPLLVLLVTQQLTSDNFKDKDASPFKDISKVIKE